MSVREISRRKVLFGAALPALSSACLLAPAASRAEGLLLRAGDPRPNPVPARPGTMLDEMAKKIVPELDLYNPHTRERYRGRWYGGKSYDMGEIDRLNWLLRDWRQGVSTQIDVRLFWALAALRQAAMRDGHSGLMYVTSGYRTPMTNDMLEGAARHSMHLAGRAVDFVLPHASTDMVYRYALWLGIGGVGHYPDQFVHVDSGAMRTWVRG